MESRNRVAGNTNSYHSYSLNEALEGIAAAGFRYVELSAVRGWTEHVPLGASAAELDGIKRKLAELNLIPVSLGGHSDVSTEPGLALALQALDLCSALNIKLMITAAGGEGGEDAFLAGMRQLAETAGTRHIELAIEIAGDMAPTGKAALKVVSRVDRPNVAINYDTANVEYYGGVNAVDDLPTVVGHLSHVHLKDKRGGKGEWDFPAIGDGHVDFPAILRILRAGGFAGPMSVEVEFLGDPWPALDEVNRAMKASFDQLTAFGLV